jgi:hypothetical protein
MHRLRAYHLPSYFSCAESHDQRFGNAELEIACPVAARWSELTASLRRACDRVRSKSQTEILATLRDVVDGWLRPDSPQRRQAEAVLPAITGFSAPMIRHGLPRLLEPLRDDAIARLLAAELISTGQNRRRPVVPDLLVHVLSGNIPGLGAVPIHLSLALGSAAIIKTASGDPFFAPQWARSIAATDPELGDCLAVTHWSGGDRSVEDAVFGGADVVVASGSDEAIAAIAARTRSRFLGHGHKVSFALIGRDRLEDSDDAARMARDLAYDVSIWDQQGCLSPQLCYIERGGRVSPEQFVTLLADGLSHYAEQLPPRHLDVEEQTAIVRFRQQCEWSAGAELLTSERSDAWSIALEPGSGFRPTCLNRCVRVKVIDGLDEVSAALVDCRRVLEAAGVAVSEARGAAIEEMLAKAGVHRICAIGKMQEPPLSWCQGGRPRVGDWVEWLEIED